MPLLERLRYLCISCTNLDEFFEVRVAVLKQHSELGELRQGPDALAPSDVLGAHPRTRADAGRRAIRVLEREPAARARARRHPLFARDTWTVKQKRWLQGYFRNECLPVLSPLGLDPAHPFPRILNKSLNLRRRPRRDATRSAAKATWRWCARRARCRASSACPTKSPKRRTISCSCRASCTSSWTSSFRAWRSRARTSSASRATASCSSTRKKSRISRSRCATSCSGRGYAQAGAARNRRQLSEERRRSPGAEFRARRAATSIAATVRSTSAASRRSTIRSTGPTSSSRRSCRACCRSSPKNTTCSTRSRERDILLHHPFESFGAVLELVRAGEHRSGRARDQADAVSRRQRFAAGRSADRRARARARTSPSSSSCARASTRKRTCVSPTACRKPACRSCTASSATRRTRRCC